MDNERLIKRTWIEAFGEKRVIAYADLPDDLLITVAEIDELGEVFPIVLFNVKLLNSDIQEGVWEKLTEFDPLIRKQAQKAEVDLRGVLVRILDTAYVWAHVDSESAELRLSLLEGWRGIRLMARTCDMLMKLAWECERVKHPIDQEAERLEQRIYELRAEIKALECDSQEPANTRV